MTQLAHGHRPVPPAHVHETGASLARAGLYLLSGVALVAAGHLAATGYAPAAWGTGVLAAALLVGLARLDRGGSWRARLRPAAVLVYCLAVPGLLGGGEAARGGPFAAVALIGLALWIGGMVLAPPRYLRRFEDR